MTGETLVREATPAEVERWDELVARFPGHRIFHTAAWMRSLRDATGARPLFLVFERDGQVVGCLPGLISTIGPLRIFGSPREGWQTESQGPVFDPARTSTHAVCAAAIRFLERREGVHHVEMASNLLDGDAMRALGFVGQPVFTYRVELHPENPELTYRRLRRDVRKNLKKAASHGLVVREETDESFVDEVYAQAREVFARHGVSVPFSRDRVHHCFRHMRSSGKLLALSVRTPEDACIATGIFLMGAGELVTWSWSHRFAARPLCPTELMTWTAMQRAMSAGCVTYDMTGGGSTKPRYGAVPDETTLRWMRSRFAWLVTLRSWAKRGYRWQQSVRGRLARRRATEVSASAR